MSDIIAGYILGFIILLFGIFVIIGNDWIFYKVYIKKENPPSIGFLIGSICAVLGIFIIFPKEYWWIAIIPVLLDYGGIYSVFYLIYSLLHD